MTGTLVLDASALLAIALHEPGGDFVLAQMRAAKNSVVHAANAFEVVCKLMLRCVSEENAWHSATRSGASLIENASGDLTMRAVRIKMSALHLSMGDCYCLALAETMGGTVLTSDKGFARAKTSAEVLLFR